MWKLNNSYWGEAWFARLGFNSFLWCCFDDVCFCCPFLSFEQWKAASHPPLNFLPSSSHLRLHVYRHNYGYICRNQILLEHTSQFCCEMLHLFLNLFWLCYIYTFAAIIIRSSVPDFIILYAHFTWWSEHAYIHELWKIVEGRICLVNYETLVIASRYSKFRKKCT